jgi:hypothetical protein
MKGYYNNLFLKPEVLKQYTVFAGESNEEKWAFWERYTAQKGSFRIKENKGSIEGYKIVRYLFVNDGELKEKFDYTMDPYSGRNYIVKIPKSIEIGYYKNGKYVPISEYSQDQEVVLILRTLYE